MIDVILLEGFLSTPLVRPPNPAPDLYLRQNVSVLLIRTKPTQITYPSSQLARCFSAHIDTRLFQQSRRALSKTTELLPDVSPITSTKAADFGAPCPMPVLVSRFSRFAFGKEVPVCRKADKMHYYFVLGHAPS